MSDTKETPREADDTGHEWDGIRELKNPPPRWWMISFYASVIWVVAYLLLYPSIPLITGNTAGILGWTGVKEFKEGMKEVEAIRAPLNKRIKETGVAEILKDPDLSQFAIASSNVLFGDNCAPCHGTGGQGATGSPVLADDDWLYGGGIESIVETIADGREGSMNGYRGSLSEKELDDVVKYVLSLGTSNIYEPGRKVFASETPSEAGCIDCHGVDAKGLTDMGSANLTDAIWRFEGSEAGIRQTILYGVNEDNPKSRKAIMPAFGGKLSPEQVKKLAVKVHLFGGGQ